MIRLLIFVILAAIILSLSYLWVKQVPLIKKMTITGGGLAAAAIAIFMQATYSWYLVVVALLGVSFLAAFAFMKLVEKEQNEKLRLAEERREEKRQKAKTYLATTTEMPAAETLQKPKPFGMQSIEAEREEITRG
ncbi:hypothetical protein ACQKDB_00500 [Planococcus kocurii]|uniref:hypothetical protein n=1 Tax=Planococcus kocurii TaxID=1374 RepID=UPI003CFF8C68